MKENKHNLILDSALIEFSEKGFSKASTNSIVNRAGVSKGLLFHYFDNKEHLLVACYENVLNYVINKTKSQTDIQHPDILIRIRDHALSKVKLYHEEPVIPKFYNIVNELNNPELYRQIKEKRESLQKEFIIELYSNFDRTLFNNKVDISKAIKVIQWTLETISLKWKNKYHGVFDDLAFTDLENQMDDYINFFRTNMYK
jgi:TetR/AcrR family transcriptional regulator